MTDRLYHWTEYGIEALGLGLFMLSACAFTALLEHPASIIRQALPDPFARRALIGIAMGLTAILLIYSPLGKRSGAHLNPAVTATFWRLGRIGNRDALFYVIAQFAGGAIGVMLFAAFAGRAIVADTSVNYVVTVPGMNGRWVAFAAEALISAVLMFTVLTVSNRPALNRYTGLAAGSLVALYIAFEAPLSGMSMNPARTLASAFAANDWMDIWIYFLAPLGGMLAAAELYLATQGASAILCCKLHHDNDSPCIFPCRYHADAPAPGAVVPA